MSRRCENCSWWSTTDKVWGYCTRIVSDYPPEGEKRASINLDTYDGTADLWTRCNFGCTEWGSLAVALKSLKQTARVAA